MYDINDGNIYDMLKYISILKYIYTNIIKNGEQIIKIGTLHYCTLPKEDGIFKGNYMEEIGITFQNAYAINYIIEIYHWCFSNNISIKMEILIENGDIVSICL